ncbi:hypothetical protein LCGC14_1858990 [marine sediment metagenome]|uniref:Uncharacterized protein n=1 Tax=marine sediment metagenome TaxID=412755 RepID=A0A0F9J758_9ZZZZ
MVKSTLTLSIDSDIHKLALIQYKGELSGIIEKFLKDYLDGGVTAKRGSGLKKLEKEAQEYKIKLASKEAEIKALKAAEEKEKEGFIEYKDGKEVKKT